MYFSLVFKIHNPSILRNSLNLRTSVKNILFFLFFFGSVTLSFSQVNNKPQSYAADSLNRLYITGLQYFNDGDITQAEIAFRSILAFPYRDKDWYIIRYYKGKAHYYLGDIYFVQKNYKKCVENYQHVVQDYGEIEEYISSFYKLGRSLILSKEEKQGINILKDFNYNYGTKTAQSDSCLYWIARGYISLENYTMALKILNQILRDYPNSPMAYEVRMLILDIDTSEANSTGISDQKRFDESLNRSQKQEEELFKKRQLLKNIQNLLILKEKALKIKERKLELLRKLETTRVQTFEKRHILKKNRNIGYSVL